MNSTGRQDRTSLQFARLGAMMSSAVLVVGLAGFAGTGAAFAQATTSGSGSGSSSGSTSSSSGNGSNFVCDTSGIGGNTSGTNSTGGSTNTSGTNTNTTGGNSGSTTGGNTNTTGGNSGSTTGSNTTPISNPYGTTNSGNSTGGNTTPISNPYGNTNSGTTTGGTTNSGTTNSGTTNSGTTNSGNSTGGNTNNVGGNGASITLSATTTQVGAQDTVMGTGFAASVQVALCVFSTPESVGTAMTDGSGNFTANVTIPTDLSTGSHTLAATDTSGNSANTPFTIDTGSGSNGTGSGAVTSSGNGGSLASTGADILMGLLAAALLVMLGTSVTLAARRRRNGA